MSPGLGQVHEVPAGPPQPIAPSAERWDVAERRDVAHHLVEAAMIAEAELALVRALLVCIPAGVRAAAGRDLRDAEGERLAADVRRLARGHDDAGVRHRQPQRRHELAEVHVAHRVRRMHRDVRPGRGFEARDADRVRADAEPAFEVPNVLEQREQFEPPVEQAEQHADADVGDPRLHRPVHCRHAPVVVALPAAEVDRRIGLPVIRLLEQLVGADLPFAERPKLVVGERRHVDIHAPNLAMAVRDAVDRVHALEHVRESLPRIRFARDQQRTLVPLVDQDAHFLGDLRLRERATNDRAVPRAERAVGALVGAHVRDVERREQDQTATVDRVLHVLRGGEQFAQQLRVADAHQHGHVGGLEAVELARLRQDVADDGGVGRRPCERIEDHGFVDERGVGGEHD